MALNRLRAERSKLSAVERRIADYILDNASLIRDYSSQQLADALKVSQSSVVKFAQRLGYKGYPDLKLSITETLARDAAAGGAAAAVTPPTADPDTARADMLWRSKTTAEQETRAANSAENVALAARLIAVSDTLFIGGGDDGEAGHSLAVRMSMLGLRSFAQGDFAALVANLATASSCDTLLLIGEPGRPECLRAIRAMRAVGGRVVVVMRSHGGRPPAGADACLRVVANDPEPYVEDLVYDAVLRHVLDDLFLRVLASRPNAAAAFQASLARSHDHPG